jgi:hypothetical protein
MLFSSLQFYGEITQQLLKNAAFPGSNNGTGLFQVHIRWRLLGLLCTAHLMGHQSHQVASLKAAVHIALGFARGLQCSRVPCRH